MKLWKWPVWISLPLQGVDPLVPKILLWQYATLRHRPHFLTRFCCSLVSYTALPKVNFLYLVMKLMCDSAIIYTDYILTAHGCIPHGNINAHRNFNISRPVYYIYCYNVSVRWFFQLIWKNGVISVDISLLTVR